MTYIHIGYPNTCTYNSCKISTQLIHQEPASAASVGSKGNHPWLSSHNPHTRRVWHNKRAVIFWLQLSHNLLILNDTTENCASEVIAVVRMISFFNRISYELRAGIFEIIHKVYSRIVQRVEIIRHLLWTDLRFLLRFWCDLQIEYDVQRFNFTDSAKGARKTAYIAISESTVKIQAAETPSASECLVHKKNFCISLLLITNQFRYTFNKTIL